MLADPQSVTIAGTAVSLPRVGISASSADYSSVDGTLTLRVQQTTNKDQKRTIISQRSNKIAADPLTAVNHRVSSIWSISNTAPLDGFTINELRDQLIGLANALTASSGALAVKILGGEK